MICIYTWTRNNITLQLLLLFYFILMRPFTLSRNIDDVFSYNHLALMSIRSRSRVKEYMILTRADTLFINNYIRSLINNILKHILMVKTRLEPTSYCFCGRRLSQVSLKVSYNEEDNVH